MNNKDDIKRMVKEFLISGIPKITFELACPDILFTAVEKAGGKIDYDTEPMETNGWQYDYWQPAEYKGQKLMISGSGFYGDACIEKVQE